jgi:hypothetical protein
MDITSSVIDGLAHRIAADGVAAHVAEVVELASTADACAAPGAALQVLLDGTAAPVARQRAFGIVTRAMAAADGAPVGPARTGCAQRAAATAQPAT